MADEYSIYIVNNSLSKKRFWLFMDKPDGLPASSVVYANSGASFNIDSKYPGTNKFIVPVQYKINAGCSSTAVGLKVQIQAENPTNVSLSEVWETSFYPPSQTQGPAVTKQSFTVGASNVGVRTNVFDKGQEEKYDWFSNVSFGIQTNRGFVGFTWSPEPNSLRDIKPTIKFYVQTGEYSSNELAQWTDVQNEAAVVTQFSAKNEATVTLSASGTWSVSKGPPSILALLGTTDGFLSEERAEFAALTYLSEREDQESTIEQVEWYDSNLAEDRNLNTFLTGTITVRTVLRYTFSYFVLSGVQFNIGRISEDGTSFSFSYHGDRTPADIRSLVRAGISILFGGGGS